MSLDNCSRTDGQPGLALTDYVEAHRPGANRVPVPRLLCGLDAVVGDNSVDLIGNGLEHVPQKLPGSAPVSLPYELGHRELSGAVNADEEIELALGSLRLGDVNVEEADRLAPELLALRLVAADVRQAWDAISLQAAVKD